jgi:hypothetical protein
MGRENPREDKGTCSRIRNMKNKNWSGKSYGVTWTCGRRRNVENTELITKILRGIYGPLVEYIWII